MECAGHPVRVGPHHGGGGLDEELLGHRRHHEPRLLTNGVNTKFPKSPCQKTFTSRNIKKCSDTIISADPICPFSEQGQTLLGTRQPMRPSRFEAVAYVIDIILYCYIILFSRTSCLPYSTPLCNRFRALWGCF